MSRLLWLVLGLFMACASVQTKRVEMGKERLARAHTLAAKARAPELWRLYEEAHTAAQREPPETAARSDRESEARLWLEAAIAEAERLELAGKRLTLERELVGLDALVLRDERAREALARDNEARAAAEIAADEQKRALERAALAPRQRPKLDKRQAQTAAEALIVRAQLVGAALSALSARPEDVANVQRALAQARAALDKDPDRALVLADQTLFFALSVLGPLRGLEAEANDAEKSSLAEALESAGARVVRNDRGLGAVLDKPFVNSALSPSARRVLERLCALGRAYPHGPVRVVVAAPSPSAAEARAHGVTELYTRAGCASERFGVDVSVTAADDVEVTWLSY